jgi:hypothetical protein
MDFITALPKTTNEFDAIIVVLDNLKKMVVFIPTMAEVDAVSPAEFFFRNLYRLYGLPSKSLSDRGGRFFSKCGPNCLV